MIIMLSGNKKYSYSFQISAVRTGVCAYKGRYTPVNLRPALIKSLIQEALLICFVCDLRVFVCLFVFTPFHKTFLRFISGDVSRNCQHWPYRGVGSVSFLAEEAEN